MAKEALDAILELSPSSNMKAEISGESLDDKLNEKGRAKAIIEIKSFRFGDAKSLAKAKEADKKAAKNKGDDDDEEEKEPVRADVGTSKKTNKVEDDYRFQITKQVEKSTPYLVQAYFSNSYKPKRKKYNSFDEARVTFRKIGAHASHPKAFFTLTFRGVYIIGYDLSTQGAEPPEETVDFCFQTCEMMYKPQLHDGSLGPPNVQGWNFVVQRHYQSNK